jgi:transposase InsO family protein
VLDNCSRYTFGWSIDSLQNLNLLVNALDMAIKNRRSTPASVVHADHRAFDGGSRNTRHPLTQQMISPGVSERDFGASWSQHQQTFISTICMDDKSLSNSAGLREPTTSLDQNGVTTNDSNRRPAENRGGPLWRPQLTTAHGSSP